MVQVSGIEKAYGQQTVFQDVSFSVGPCEKIGLVGRNGSGKTTLFRLITGEEQPDSGTIAITNGYKIGYLSQHIHFSRPTVVEEASSSLCSDDGTDQTYLAKSILQGLGFSKSDFSLPPSILSGGFQVRLNLAKVLLSSPNLLLLDEPTNYLDILSIRWLKQFLKNWKNQLILITHDRDFMDSVTTHTMALHRCRVRKIEGPTQKIYDQLIQEEEVQERTRINDDRKRQEIDLFINRFRAQANRARAVQSRIKALKKKGELEKIQELKNLEFSFNSAPFLGKTLIEINGVSFSYEASDLPLIHDLTFYIAKKDRIGIIGKNGKGKTTLLNILAGNLTPSSGTIQYHPGLKMGYFGQMNIERLSPYKTVEEEIIGSHPDHNRNAARNICGTMLFEEDNALKKIGVLSGGEKSRVLLGKLLVTPANLLLLDEPTNHLDMESVDSLVEAFDDFGGAVVIVTHSEMILNAFAKRLIVFDQEKTHVFEGNYQDFLERVGWKDDAEASAGLQAKPGTACPEGRSKQELRRARAQIIATRSKITNPLQKRISEIEDQITRLEQNIADDNTGLVEASGKGDWPAIAKLSRNVQEAKTKIESLIEEWEHVSAELAVTAKEFEEKLKLVSS